MGTDQIWVKVAAVRTAGEASRRTVHVPANKARLVVAALGASRAPTRGSALPPPSWSQRGSISRLRVLLRMAQRVAADVHSRTDVIGHLFSKSEPPVARLCSPIKREEFWNRRQVPRSGIRSSLRTLLRI